MSVNPMHYPVCGAALAAVLPADFGKPEPPTFCELREGHAGDHRGEFCGPTCCHPNETNEGETMTLRDATAEPSWEALAALEYPKYPEAGDPSFSAICARRDAIREAKTRMDDEIAFARCLARRGLPAEAWPEGDARLTAWREILWERLPWTQDGDYAPRSEYSAERLRAVAQRVEDASKALALLLADAKVRCDPGVQADGCPGCRECDPSRFPSVGDDAS